jgi:hypothetical protein
MIEMEKEYQTRSGAAVRLYATDGQNKEQPVVGERREANGSWRPTVWSKNGSWLPTGEPHCHDLIQVKPTRVFERWVNVHPKGIYTWHQTPLHAFNHAADRIACLHIRQEYREGDGLSC